MRPKCRHVADARSFSKDETAQDTIEYALLLAFIILAACCVVMMSGESVSGVWTQSSGVLSQAESVAGAAAPAVGRSGKGGGK